MCLYINDSPRPSDLYWLEISSRFTVNFPIRSPMFYTWTRHFPLFAAAVGRWLFAMVRAFRCTLYHLQVLHVLSEGARWFAPIHDVRTRPRDATFVIWISHSSVRSALYICAVICAYTCSAACRKHVHMCTHVSEIFARAYDVPHAEAWGVLHKFNHHKNRWINAIDTVCDCHRAYFWVRRVLISIC